MSGTNTSLRNSPGLAVQAWQCLLRCITSSQEGSPSSLLQGTFCVIVAAGLAIPAYDDDDVEDLRSWRLNIAHHVQ